MEYETIGVAAQCFSSPNDVSMILIIPPTPIELSASIEISVTEI